MHAHRITDIHPYRASRGRSVPRGRDPTFPVTDERRKPVRPWRLIGLINSLTGVGLAVFLAGFLLLCLRGPVGRSIAGDAGNDSAVAEARSVPPETCGWLMVVGATLLVGSLARRPQPGPSRDRRRG